MEGVVVSAEDAAQQRVLLDALPYIDREYEDPAVQAMVRSMIEAEMAAMEPRDYLAHLPPPPSLDRFADAAAAAAASSSSSRPLGCDEYGAQASGLAVVLELDHQGRIGVSAEEERWIEASIDQRHL